MSELKHIIHELNEMGVTVQQLAKLEDYDDVDYSEVVTDLQWLHQMLKHRLTTLQLRKR